MRLKGKQGKWENSFAKCPGCGGRTQIFVARGNQIMQWCCSEPAPCGFRRSEHDNNSGGEPEARSLWGDE